MSSLLVSPGFFPSRYFLATGQYIASVQLQSGAIPWQPEGLLDPWDHVEAAMGLAICGLFSESRKAYGWLAEQQEPDGSFWPAYVDRTPLDTSRKESHHAAYPATGVWHAFLLTGDTAFLEQMWPCVRDGLDFACSLQTEHGEIAWALKPDGIPDGDALITGCSSIYKSLECGLNMAQTLGLSKPEWDKARTLLGQAIADKPHRFDRTWPSKARYSMDWFYPVLCGVLERNQARQRLQRRWSEFVEDGLGCRCVQDEPWITVAETCELVLALLAAGERAKAVRVFSWLQHNRCSCGGYWTGYQRELDIYWPEEKPTWTAGAVLLAVDALTQATPAAELFMPSSSPAWAGLEPAPPLRQATMQR